MHGGCIAPVTTERRRMAVKPEKTAAIPPADPKGLSTREFARRAAIAVGLAALGVVLLLFVWYAVDVLLLTFAGILLAVFFRGLAAQVAAYTSLGEKGSLALVVVVLLVVLVVAVSVSAATIAGQVDRLVEQVPESLNALRSQLAAYAWGEWLIDAVESEAAGLTGRRSLSHATSFAYSTLGGLGSLLIVAFVGVYLAIEPKLYIDDGLLRLVPPRHRARGRQIVRQIGYSLHWWLIGQFVAMAIVGGLTWLGLSLLGIPLALLLAVIATLLGFIPNFGPIISAVPAMLMALLQGPQYALYVALLYLAIQTLESYFITPYIQRRAVSLPAALVIMSQILLGALMGLLGLMLATPLTAAALVLIRELYVEDTLGDDGLPSSGREPS